MKDLGKHAGWLMALLVMATAFGCSRAPRTQVRPALWEVRGDNGQVAWLFGTVHALPEPVEWRSPAMDKAIHGADALLMEITNADDPAAINRIYSRLAASRGLPPLAARLPKAVRARSIAQIKALGMAPDQFGETETWAVALSITRKIQGDARGEFGMEQELIRALKGKPLDELEGAEAQLQLFDKLPEKEQQDLLLAVLDEATRPEDGKRLATAWMSGDMKTLTAETRSGLLADAELRYALLDGRNLAWADKIVLLLEKGSHPLVAVGAAHMAGPDGLPGLLARRGYTVRRMQ